MTFAELTESARPYLTVFDYDHYPDCFRQFEADAKPLFDTLTGESGPALAAALVTDLAQLRLVLPRRAQKDAAFEQKQVLGLFLSPAARRHSATALAFTEEVRRLWCEMYPKNGYLAGDFEQIMKGFDANLLGLHLRKSKKR